MKVKYATGMPALEIGRGTLQLSKRMDHQPYTNLTSFYITFKNYQPPSFRQHGDLRSERPTMQWTTASKPISDET